MDEKKRRNAFVAPLSWTSAYQKDWTTNPDLGQIATGQTSPITSLETTQSRGHAWPSGRGALTDVGGDFTTIKVTRLDAPAPVGTGRGYGYYYKGPEMATSPGGAMDYALSLVTPSSEVKLMQLGSTAIARSIPTNPVADAGTFLGELKAGLPKAVGKELLKTKFKDYRKVGSEYLNVEFGWKPLISDLQKFGQATIESEKILKQLHRDSGKNIHRKFTFPDEVLTETWEANYQQSWACGLSLYPYLYKNASGGPIRGYRKITTKTWFSGCFTYHLNLGDSTQDRIQRAAAEARKLYGVELTPETVWNLAPWSWAVDWEGNIGDVLHNVSRFSQDGLVMRYGYIMQQKTATVTFSLHPAGRLSSAPNEDLKLTVEAISKVRRRATPFGFGFDMTALTGRQSAILGALGISRGPRHL